MFKKVLWYSVVFIALIGFSALSFGFYKALKVTGSSNNASSTGKTAKAPSNSAPEAAIHAANPNAIKITILGDSVAKGTGDEKGTGFAGYLAEDLESQSGKKTIISDLGIDGLQSGGLLEQLQSGKSDPLISNSGFILISIGGNDVRTLEPSHDIVKEDEYRKIQDIYLDNLKTMLKLVRNHTNSAVIVFVGLYNPFEDSYVNTSLISAWNSNTQQLIEEDKKAVFVPTYDLFKLNKPKFLAADGLHPNSAGYQAISQRIMKVVENVLH